MGSNNEKVTALAIAEYFLDKSKKVGKGISNKKLQKLVYYAQAWSLVLKNQALFDENIEAWVHGPAVRSLYGVYKSYGYNYITKEPNSDQIAKLSEEVIKLLDSVWNVYGELDADYLEMLTHSELPWKEARQGLESSQSSDNRISLETMKSFYSEKLEKANG